MKRPLIQGIALGAVLGLAATLHAQLRVVSYNVLNNPDNTTEDGLLRTLVQRIATTQPAGLAHPPALFALQETDTDSAARLAPVLNAALPGANFATLTSDSVGGDMMGLAYDRTQLTLTTSSQTTLGTRPALYGRFQPVGYTRPEAALHVFNIHLDASSATTRASEALTLRSAIDALGPGASVIVLGDFNMTGSSESGYVTLTANGEGRMHDPLNRPGAWRDNAAFADLHTQSTRTTQFGGGASGGMDDRFDLQLTSDELLDGEGLSYLTGSYQTLGNNGQLLNRSVNDPINTSQPAAVLDALYQFSDHLPVIADYQLPARLAATASPAPVSALVGASVHATLTVTNTAAAGGDELDFALTATGGLIATASGSLPATGSQAVQAVFDTSMAGLRSAAVTVNTASQAAENPSVTLTGLELRVLDRGRASFDAQAPVRDMVIDLGPWTRAQATLSQTVSVFNLVGALGPAWTADVVWAGVEVMGDADVLSLGALPSIGQALAAAQAWSWQAALDPTRSGELETSYVIHLTDPLGLAGAAAHESLTLTLRATVVSSAVPEPGAGLVMLLGGWLMACRRGEQG